MGLPKHNSIYKKGYNMRTSEYFISFTIRGQHFKSEKHLDKVTWIASVLLERIQIYPAAVYTANHGKLSACESSCEPTFNVKAIAILQDKLWFARLLTTYQNI